MKFHWERWLKENVYEYHNQFMYQLNSLIELQMGILLPFISSYLLPEVFGLLNIAASGVRKSKARQKLISGPMEYMPHNILDGFKDFEVSYFTRAGL